MIDGFFDGADEFRRAWFMLRLYQFVAIGSMMLMIGDYILARVGLLGWERYLYWMMR